jgi:hypothetical protein|tara:strand:+ start:3282 stop:3461 length:180 start_codon:yes stop_codon:yes gene_type:complete
MRKGKVTPLFKPFPQGKQHTWQQQQLFIQLSNRNQEERDPFLFGSSRSLYGQAKYASQS